MIITYVEFAYPGTLFSDTSSKKVESRNIRPEFPKGAFAYRFYDVEEVESNGEILRGDVKNRSGWFYKAGRVYTLEQVERLIPDNHILISNMRSNDIKRVIQCSQGMVRLYEEDTVLDY